MDGALVRYGWIMFGYLAGAVVALVWRSGPEAFVAAVVASFVMAGVSVAAELVIRRGAARQ